MKLRQKILLGILVVVLGIYVYVNFISPNTGGGPPAPIQRGEVGRIPVTENPRQQAAPQVMQDTLKDTESIPVSLDWKKDPFYREQKIEAIARDTVATISRTAGLSLTGIHAGEGDFIVTINDEFYRKGEFVDGTLKIVAIGKNYVVLREGGKEYILRLKSL